MRMLCLLLFSSVWWTASGVELPKIRVAGDQRGFVTESGTPFIPVGVNYFRPHTGWAPQVWKKFDVEATAGDFKKLKELGFNCVRVFLSYGSFCTEPGIVKPEGFEKFDRFLELAENAGIYVHPAGLDHWEGPPTWPTGIEEEKNVAALEQFWKTFVARYRGRSVVFAYDLKNEPEVGWDNATLRTAWNIWLQKQELEPEALARKWGYTNQLKQGEIPTPAQDPLLGNIALKAYQDFREYLADEWTRRQSAAIRAADPKALVTVGLIQWSVPALIPAGSRHYAAFRPQRQAAWLDFLEIHFYPLERGVFGYRNEEEELANLAYLEAILREVAKPGKPVVLAEFGWYGGGKPTFGGGGVPAATQEQQAQYCRRLVQSSAGWACGWLNWGMFDHPGAGDCTELIGLFTADGELKAWGTEFGRLARFYQGKKLPLPALGPRPELNWNDCVLKAQAGHDFRREYFQAFQKDKTRLDQFPIKE
jgi:hypothetical protein